MPPLTRRARSLSLALVIFAALSGAALYVNFRAARLVSDFVSGVLGQPVSVSAVGFGPVTGLTLYGLEVENPPGYRSPYLLKIDTLSVKPSYNEIFRGRLVIDRVFAGSPSMHLEKTGQGRWNFQVVVDYLKKKKPRKYTVSEFRIRRGKVAIPSFDSQILVPEASVLGLSTINPGQVRFELAVTDGKGLYVEGSGSATPFGTPATLKAKFSLEGNNLDAYLKPPAGVDLSGSSLMASLDLDFDGARLAAGLDGEVTGVKPRYYKGKKGLGARMTVRAKYLQDKDELNLDNARLDLAGLTQVRISGKVSGVRQGAALDLTAHISPVNLGAAAPYLPKGVKISGLLRPEAVSVKGTISPLRLYASGDAVLESATVQGYAIDHARAGYAYTGNTLSLRDISIEGTGVSASARNFVLGYKDGGVHSEYFGGSVSYKDISLSGIAGNADAIMGLDSGIKRANGTLTIRSGSIYGLGATLDRCGWEYSGGAFETSLSGSVAGNPYLVKAGAAISGGHGLKNPDISGNLRVVRLVSINPLLARFKSPVSFAEGTADISASLKGETARDVGGEAFLKVGGLGLNKAGKPLIRGITGEFRPVYADDTVTLPGADIKFGDSFKLNVSGRATRQEDVWSAEANLEMQETGLAPIQEGVLEALPPKIKWADVSGKAAFKSKLGLSSGGAGRVTGELRLDGARLDMPDEGASVGPVDGAIPLNFSFGAAGSGARVNAFRDEPFEKEAYGGLLKKYSARPAGTGLVIKKASYGLVELEDITIELKPGNGYYGINWFGLSTFGGRVYGYGLADFSAKDARYAVSFLVSDFSLAELCGRAPSIKGYISGRVDGLMRVLVAGRGYGDVAGAAMFWAKDAPGEKRVISKEFLKRLMGKSAKYSMLIGDRRFDTGELDVIFSDGDLVFDKLLISHTNFLGMRDLNVSVAPVSNKISIEHLLDIVREVKERAEGGQP